jgi:hypothetical protein
VETRIDYSRAILNEFLERWTLEEVNNLTLEKYVGLHNPDTFCQWIETRTIALGSIKGITSIKFGIYKRNDTTKRPKNYRNDALYSWQSYFGENRNEAFENIKKEILQIIQFATVGDFEAIDNLHLTNFFKWKIAYLYSNERLIPIFKKEVLEKIGRHFGLKVDRNTTNSEIQRVIIENKPSHLNVYEYSEYLFNTFGREEKNQKESNKKRTRKASESKNVTPHVRTIMTSYIADFKHNRLQEALKKKLVKKHGSSAVKMEENFVDIKLFLAESIIFYEIKSASYASDCVREALGQILSYTYYDKEAKPKKIKVVGQYPPNENEKDFIKYIKRSLNIDFDYENIDIE